MGLLGNGRVMAPGELVGLRGTFSAATNTPLGFRWEREGCGAGHAESPGWPGQRCGEDAFQLCKCQPEVQQRWHPRINSLALKKLGVRQEKHLTFLNSDGKPSH